MPNFDLHSHSKVSDGLFSPAEVVTRAAHNGVEALALTDHDSVDGLAEARATAEQLGIAFVDGVEISVTWNNRTLHVVGLCIDASHPELRAGLASVRSGRITRAREIGAALDKEGILGSFEGALQSAANKNLVGRTHFARFIVEKGYVKDVKTVFQKYLVQGKPGYVPHRWAALPDAIDWITASGGTAVLAHPGRYDIGAQAMQRLLAEFKQLGGEAIEVVTSNHTPEQVKQFALHAKRHALFASRGSDFHGDAQNRIELGRVPDLPSECEPIWERLGIRLAASLASLCRGSAPT